MKENNKYTLNNFRQVLFVSLFAFPVLPGKTINTLFIIFSLTVIFLFVKEKRIFEWKAYLPYALLGFVFVPYFVEFLLHSKDPAMSFELEKKLLFFFAPPVFYLNGKLKNNGIKNALLCFTVSMSLLAIVSFFYLILSGKLLSAQSYENGAYGLRSVFEDFAGLHPTYFGLFATTASLWILFYLDNYKGKYKITLVVCLFFLVLLNLLVASKMPLFIFFIGILTLAYIKTKNRTKLAVIYISFFAGLVLLTFLIPSLRSRVLEVRDFFISGNFGNTLTERSIIFHCSRSVFWSDLFTGIGARNVQGVMDYCYVWFGFHKGALIHLNPHNQYLSFGIAYGIGFLLFFAGTLYTLFRKLKRSIPALLFLMALLLVMFTESILERQMGIYFYLFFSGLFLSMQIPDQQKL